jgi:hypothetical protein
LSPHPEFQADASRYQNLCRCRLTDVSATP